MTLFKNEESAVHVEIINKEFVEEQFRCSMCKEVFISEKNLSLHMYIHYRAIKCPICKLDFSRPLNLKRHLQRHMDVLNYKCDVCDEAYVSMALLNEHIRNHNNKNIGLYTCSKCSIQLSNLKEYLQHKNVHKDVKLQIKLNWKKKQFSKNCRHRCSECDKPFPTKSLLMRHMRIHTGLQPYKCNVCNKYFNQSNSLKTHMLIHNGYQPYTCKFCEKRFFQHGNLRTHIKSRHTPVETIENENHIICILCMKLFRRLDQLQIHYEQIHKKNESFINKKSSKSIEANINKDLIKFNDDVNLCNLQDNNTKVTTENNITILDNTNLYFTNSEDTININNQNNTTLNDLPIVSNNVDFSNTSSKSLISLKNSNSKNINEKVNFNNKSNFVNNYSINQLAKLDSSNSKDNIDYYEQNNLNQHKLKPFFDTNNANINKSVFFLEKELEETDVATQDNCSNSLDQSEIVLTQSGKPVEVMAIGKTGEHLEYYIVNIKGERWLHCPICNRQYKTRHEIQRHLLIHTDNRIHSCLTCPKVFRTKATLLVHQLTHEDKKFKCTECGSAFSQQNVLAAHIRKHTGAKPFKCLECGKSFRTSGQRSTHKKSHLRSKLANKNKSISTSSELNQIIQLANPIWKKTNGEISSTDLKRKETDISKKFTCTICNKMFSKSSNLNSHLKIHGEKVSFPCEVCNKVLTTSSNLKQHAKSHSKEKPFECATCKDKYSTMGSLNRHAIKHKQLNEEYICPYCMKKFVSEYSCKRHIKTHRKEFCKKKIDPASCLQINNEVIAKYNTQIKSNGVDVTSDFTALQLPQIDSSLLDVSTADENTVVGTYPLESENDKKQMFMQILNATDQNCFIQNIEGASYFLDEDQNLYYIKEGDFNIDNSEAIHVVIENRKDTLTEGLDMNDDEDKRNVYFENGVEETEEVNDESCFNATVDNGMEHLKEVTKNKMKDGKQATFESSNSLNYLKNYEDTNNKLNNDFTKNINALNIREMNSVNISQLDSLTMSNALMTTTIDKTIASKDKNHQFNLESSQQPHITFSNENFSYFIQQLNHLNVSNRTSFLQYDANNIDASSVHNLELNLDANNALSTLQEFMVANEEGETVILQSSGDIVNNLIADTNNPFVDTTDITCNNVDGYKDMSFSDGSFLVGSGSNIYGNILLDENGQQFIVLQTSTGVNSLTDQTSEVVSSQITSNNFETFNTDNKMYVYSNVDDAPLVGTNIMDMGKFVCDICKRHFKKASHLKQHSYSHTGEKPHKCDACNKSFLTRSILKVHLKSHLSIKEHACTLCQMAFVSKFQLDRHMSVHEVHVCAICNIHVARNQRKKHMAKHEEENNQSYVSVQLLAELTQSSTQANENIDSSTTKNKQCTVCTKSFKNSSDLSRHIATHTQEKSFKCSECGNSFRLQSQLNRHLMTHKNKMDRMHYECHLCSATYTAKTSLKLHIKKHCENEET